VTARAARAAALGARPARPLSPRSHSLRAGRPRSQAVLRLSLHVVQGKLGGGTMTTKTAPPRRCAQPIIAGATPEERDPATWSADVLVPIQRILDRSRRRAGQAVRDTFEQPERQMTALEFVTFWNGARLKAMATVGTSSEPHIAPVHAEFVNGRLRSTIYENAVRRRDLRENPRVALTTWGPHGAAAIVYGRAREIPNSRRETRPGATGQSRRTVALDIEITRIYAMKGREQ
jgi:hypothetical protein